MFRKSSSDNLVEALDLLARGRDIYQARSTYSTSSNMAVDKLRPYLDEDSRSGNFSTSIGKCRGSSKNSLWRKRYLMSTPKALSFYFPLLLNFN